MYICNYLLILNVLDLLNQGSARFLSFNSKLGNTPKNLN